MYFTKLVRKSDFLAKSLILTSSFIISLIRKIIKKEKSNSGNILIFSIQRIGDAIFSLDTINSIIRYYPDRKIIILCKPASAEIYHFTFPEIKLIIVTPDDFYFTNRIIKARIRNEIRALHPEKIYDLSGCIATASLLLTSSSRDIIGSNLPYYKNIYSYYIPFRKEPHITDLYTDIIKDLMPVVPYIIPGNEINRNDYLLIHPLAGWAAKEWILNNFISLAEFFSGYQKSIIVIPQNSFTEETLNEIRQKGITVREIKSVEELIDIIRNCNLFIGNDSGPVHIANLLGKPTVTIYGPTNPDYHKPLRGKNLVIMNQIHCSPKKDEKWCASYGGFFCSSYDCLLQLAYEDVKRKIFNFYRELNFAEVDSQ